MVVVAKRMKVLIAIMRSFGGVEEGLFTVSDNELSLLEMNSRLGSGSLVIIFLFGKFDGGED